MEARLFEEGTIPEWTTPEWYKSRDRARHLEEPPHVSRLLTTRDFVIRSINMYGVTTVSDMGAGDGGLLSILPDNVKKWGYDLQPSNIEGAKQRGVMVMLANVLTAPVEWGECTVVTEVLEHLVDPHGFVRSIPSKVVIASSPRTETADSHYAFHLWAWDEPGYRALLDQGGYEIALAQSCGIFQVVMGIRR